MRRGDRLEGRSGGEGKERELECGGRVWRIWQTSITESRNAMSNITEWGGLLEDTLSASSVDPNRVART